MSLNFKNRTLINSLGDTPSRILRFEVYDCDNSYPEAGSASYKNPEFVEDRKCEENAYEETSSLVKYSLYKLLF